MVTHIHVTHTCSRLEIRPGYQDPGKWGGGGFAGPGQPNVMTRKIGTSEKCSDPLPITRPWESEDIVKA
jgi:hypothetical protein